MPAARRARIVALPEQVVEEAESSNAPQTTAHARAFGTPVPAPPPTHPTLLAIIKPMGLSPPRPSPSLGQIRGTYTASTLAQVADS